MIFYIAIVRYTVGCLFKSPPAGSPAKDGPTKTSRLCKSMRAMEIAWRCVADSIPLSRLEDGGSPSSFL
jgi:hypothetical protein